MELVVLGQLFVGSWQSNKEQFEFSDVSRSWNNGLAVLLISDKRMQMGLITV